MWYDGGMRPPVPSEFYDWKLEFPSEGMMFQGDKGTIMAGFRLEEPYLLSSGKPPPPKDPALADAKRAPGVLRFIEGVKNGQQIAGSFRQAWPLTEAVNLYAAALRAKHILYYNADQMRVINDDKANSYLDRTYRAGWEPENI